MSINEYIAQLRAEKGYSLLQLSKLCGVSNVELHRIEKGERKKITPGVLKALAPHFGVEYEVLLTKAGYIEEVIEHDRYLEKTYRDDNGNLADIIRQAKLIDDKDAELLKVVSRAADKLSHEDIDVIKDIINSFMEDASDVEMLALKTVAKSLKRYNG